ncbi:hypothetical protein FRC02_009561 [Tulasnella sp. 418]|nr:hypothetical protein FRC02_009561 [Tulasnella sp. 418]
MPVPQASTSRSGIAKSSKSGMLKSVPHVRSPASTTSPLPNVRRTDTRVHDSQISETRRPFDESIRNEQTHAISSQNGPSTPPRVPRRTKDRKIERESTEVSNTPTERNTTVTPPPPRPVRPLPRRCTQSPILQTINRRMREKNSDQEREFLDRSNLEQGEDAQTQHQLLGVSSRSGPSAPARPSISVRQQQPRPLAQSSRGLKSPSLSLPLTSPSATRLPFASTSDAFSLPAASRRAPPTSDISRLKTVQSQDQQAATEPHRGEERGKPIT